MTGEPKDRLGIQSAEVAAAILRALTEAGRPVPLKELARRAQLHPGKAHRYLVSLTRTELVEQDPGTGHYGVGPAAIALGLVGLRTVDAVRCASSFLPRLRDEIDETALLALWTSAGPVIVRLEESSRPVFMNIRVGSVLPLLPTATGRVFAAFLPRERTQPLLETEHARAAAGSPLYAPGAAERLLTEARDQGFAAVSGDMIPGVNAMAAPILDHKGRIAAVIGALGRTEELDVSPEGRVAAALKRTAGEISRRLGNSVAAE